MICYYFPITTYFKKFKTTNYAKNIPKVLRWPVSRIRSCDAMTCNSVASQGPEDGSSSFLRNVGSPVPYDKTIALIFAL